MAVSWRTYKRNNDRHTATLLVQLALSAIPRGSGYLSFLTTHTPFHAALTPHYTPVTPSPRTLTITASCLTGKVAEWLGPAYFNEELPVSPGGEARILRVNDKAGFRNAYKYSKLVSGSVNLVGNTYSEVSVMEKFGPKFVIRNGAGKEQVLCAGELRRCKLNPHIKRDDPSVSKHYHVWNRKACQRIQVGTFVEYIHENVWVKAPVVRIVRGPNFEKVVYTVRNDRVLNAKSVKLSPRTVRWARKQNKLWCVGAQSLTTPDSTYMFGMITLYVRTLNPGELA